MALGEKPKFIIIYKCDVCSLESGYTEQDIPVCRYCRAQTNMVEISKQELTLEVMAARLKTVTDSMMKNMELAFESMSDEDKATKEGGFDAEGAMLKLMAKIQKFKDDVQNLKLRSPDDGN